MKKRVNLFVSRLHVDTTGHTVVSYVKDILRDAAGISMLDSNIVCDKLVRKFDTYSSFSVSVLVDCTIWDKISGLLLCDANWPDGVLIRRFFNRKIT